MSASNNSFVLVTIITVFNVMQEVIDSLIFVYMSFTSSSSVISKTLERNELCMYLVSRFGGNHHLFTLCIHGHNR